MTTPISLSITPPPSTIETDAPEMRISAEVEKFVKELEDYFENKVQGTECIEKCLEICNKKLEGNSDWLSQATKLKMVFAKSLTYTYLMQVNEGKMNQATGMSVSMQQGFDSAYREFLLKKWVAQSAQEFVPLLAEDRKQENVKTWVDSFFDGVEFFKELYQSSLSDSLVCLLENTTLALGDTKGFEKKEVSNDPEGESKLIDDILDQTLPEWDEAIQTMQGLVLKECEIRELERMLFIHAFQKV